MYATNLTDQLFSAALPLKPLVAWCGSACSVTVAVPPAAALAGLNIGSVGVTLSLPDGSNVAAQAVHVANTPFWTATFPAANFATSGTVAQGLMVTLAGEDEHGVVRTWIVAKGDLEVRPGDASPSPSGSWVAVKLRDGAPENPVEGDAYVADGRLSIYVNGAWVTIGGGGVVVDPSIDPESENPVENRAVAAALGGVYTALQGKAAAADLPYAMATLTPGSGEWSFSGGLEPGAYTIGNPVFIGGQWHVPVTNNVDGEQYDAHGINAAEDDLSVTFEVDSHSITFTATRPYANGATLLDRASNVVPVSSATTLVLPAAIAGHMRDFLVRLTASASSAVTFSIAQGESWDAMGNPSATLAAGTYLYRITEVAAGVFHAEDMLALVGLEAALAAINGGVAS